MSLSDVQSLVDDLDQAEDFAPGWKPEAGDLLVGVVEHLSTRETDFGSYPIVTLVTDAAVASTQGGENLPAGERIAFHGTGTATKDRLEKAAPQPGDMIAVRYDGKKASQNGRSYHSYAIRVKRAEAPEGMPF